MNFVAFLHMITFFRHSFVNSPLYKWLQLYLTHCIYHVSNKQTFICKMETFSISLCSIVNQTVDNCYYLLKVQQLWSTLNYLFRLLVRCVIKSKDDVHMYKSVNKFLFCSVSNENVFISMEMSRIACAFV
jgi:hypothetical protein